MGTLSPIPRLATLPCNSRRSHFFQQKMIVYLCRSSHRDSRTHPRRTLPRPGTFPTDTSPTRQIPDGHFPDQTNARQIFARVDTSHNGHFPDRLNTSNNLKYLKKYIVRDSFGNIHGVLELLRYS